MTRAETLAAIKEALNERLDLDPLAQCHFDGCATYHSHQDCAIAWLLQEIEYLTATASVWQSMHNVSEQVLQDLRERFTALQAESDHLRAEIARVDAIRVASYLASQQK